LGNLILVGQCITLTDKICIFLNQLAVTWTAWGATPSRLRRNLYRDPNIRPNLRYKTNVRLLIDLKLEWTPEVSVRVTYTSTGT